MLHSDLAAVDQSTREITVLLFWVLSSESCLHIEQGRAQTQLFPENADIVDLVLRHYYHGASGWDTARFDSKILSVQYGPAGDVIAAGDSDGRIHLICTQTGAKILCHKGHR